MNFWDSLKNANSWRVSAHYFRWNILLFIDIQNITEINIKHVWSYTLSGTTRIAGFL